MCMDGIQSGPNLEPFPTNAWRELPAPFLAPPGATNVALGKKVTTSAPRVIGGDLEHVTDGSKEPTDADCVEFSKGLQWIQVDLGRAYSIIAVVIWHENRGIQYFRDVVVQVADDAGFTNNVRTLFNNDADGSSGLGRGSDKEYYETRWGKLIDGKRTQARYVRSYTNGRDQHKLNALQEMEVYAAGGPASETPEGPTSQMLRTRR